MQLNNFGHYFWIFFFATIFSFPLYSQPTNLNPADSATNTALNQSKYLNADNFLRVSNANLNAAIRLSEQATMPVKLTDFSVKLSNNGKIDLNWQTASESNNDRFIVLVSIDGNLFNEVAIINSKSKNGNSSTPLDYIFSFDPNNLALAGFGLLGLLLMPVLRNRLIKIFFLAMAIFSIASCTKEELETKEKTLYIKLVQVDYNGTQTELGIKQLKFIE